MCWPCYTTVFMRVQSPLCRNLLQPTAPSLEVLARELIHKVFSFDERPAIAGSNSRPVAAGTLIHILRAQAEHDGFRLIILSTEPKRIILACERQGKSTPSNHLKTGDGGKQETPASLHLTDAAILPSHTTLAKFSSKLNGVCKRRCGCKVRVNINYSADANGWRITSFNREHNHLIKTCSLGLDTITKVKQEANDDKYDYEVTAEMIQNAMLSYCNSHQPPPTLDKHLQDAVLHFNPINSNPHKLAALADVSTDILHKQEHINVSSTNNSSNLLHPPNLTISTTPTHRNFQAAQPASAGPLESYGQLSSSLKNDFRSNSQIRCLDGTRHHPHQQSLFRVAEGVDYHQPPLYANQLKNITVTAVEVDRYAMLHTAFKSLISVACKRREWTQDILGKIGAEIEKLQPLLSPVSPSSQEGSKPLDAATMTSTSPPPPLEQSSPGSSGKRRRVTGEFLDQKHCGMKLSADDRDVVASTENELCCPLSIPNGHGVSALTRRKEDAEETSSLQSH